MPGQRIPKDVLLDGARMTLAGLTVGVVGFLKERGIPAKALADYMGKHFEGSWEGLIDTDPATALSHLMTLEVLPTGVEVRSSRGDDDSAEAVVSSLPPTAVLAKFGTTPKDLLDGFGVTRAEVAAVYGMYEAPARAVGLRFSHSLNGARQTLRIERATAGKKRATPRKPAKGKAASSRSRKRKA